MWKDLSKEWQAAFEEAWAAFCSGSVPIGAALFDRDGQLVFRDRNRCAEAGTVNRRISHAEANLLRKVDTDRSGDLRSMKLYTTMEPCPMCMGTIVMANIRDIDYAAADDYCGAVHLLRDDAYMNAKHTKYRHMGGEHELFQLTIQSYYELKRIDEGHTDVVLKDFRKSNPRAVAIAEKLYQDKLLDRWSKEKEVSGVFDAVCAMNGELPESI